MTELDLHNFFFYPNTCHVCKCCGNEINLKRCNCKMISYCGKEHQKQHWLQHKNLCRILSEIIDETDQSNPLEGFKGTIQSDWVKAKMNLMLLVSLKLQRKLLPYEEEMFKFPKSCVVCHEVDSKLLVDCPSCPCANFCKEHENDTNHEKLCKTFSLCYDLDIASTVFDRQPPKITVPYHTEIAYLPTSMDKFIDLYINEAIDTNELQNARISEYLTRPLTLLRALEKLEYKVDKEMTIHVIGANFLDLDGVEIWEILLHWLPSLTTLNLILIGPELNNNSKKKIICNVCQCCDEKNMKLCLEIYGVFYKDYVFDDRYKKPDIVIGYNLGVHECENLNSPNDTWSQSIKILAEQKCPFVVTSYTLEEIEKEQNRLCDIMEKKLNYLCCEKNQYSSLRPHRDYETEGVYYQNQYLIVYKNF